jgi:hypothetical protein
LFVRKAGGPDQGCVIAEAASRNDRSTGTKHRRILSEGDFQRTDEQVPGRAYSSPYDRVPYAQGGEEVGKANPECPTHLIEKLQGRSVSFFCTIINGFRVELSPGFERLKRGLASPPA